MVEEFKKHQASEVNASGASQLLPNAYGVLRGFKAIGYSLPEALSDLIDNSIDAKAKNVVIQFGRTNDVWSTGGALAKAIGYHSQWGTQNATLVAAGGSGSVAPYFTGTTQIYNGTTWTNPGHVLITERGSTAGTGLRQLPGCCQPQPNRYRR